MWFCDALLPSMLAHFPPAGSLASAVQHLDSRQMCAYKPLISVLLPKIELRPLFLTPIACFGRLCMHGFLLAVLPIPPH